MLIDIYKELTSHIPVSTENALSYPVVLEFHPVLNQCNLKCSWCIGQLGERSHPLFMSFSAIGGFIRSAYQVDRETDWPKEIHLCGNNSEPLLNSNFVKELCRFVGSKSVIEIVTNGVLLENIFQSLPYIDKISISLDAFDPGSFASLKGGTPQQFYTILGNIERISHSRREGCNNVTIYTTFVLDQPPEDYHQAKGFIDRLRSIGVNHIQFRANYLNHQRHDRRIQNFVSRLCDDFSTPVAIDYGVYDPTVFFIKYNEYTSGKRTDNHCYMRGLWPIITPQYLVFPCAHMANESNTDMAKELEPDGDTDYYAFWRESLEDSPVTCKLPQLCPSIANAVNYLYRDSHIFSTY